MQQKKSNCSEKYQKTENQVISSQFIVIIKHLFSNVTEYEFKKKIEEALNY